MNETNIRHTVLPRTLIFIWKEKHVLLMSYSGKGGIITKEKKERAGLYNGIGGHVEEGEDIIDSAVREAEEEAGVILQNPKLKGIMHVKNFAGKNIINFIVTGTAQNDGFSETKEGKLAWIAPENLDKLPILDDVKPILETLRQLKNGEIFTGTAEFDGSFKLLDLQIHIV